MHMSCLVHGLHGVWCFVSGVGRWHTGQHTQRVCHSVSKGRRLRGFCYPPHSHLMCVWTHVCVHKAHFPSSSRSVVSQARLSRGGSESLAYKTTCTAQLFCRKTYRLSSLDPTLAFCLFKDPCWYKRFFDRPKFHCIPGLHHIMTASSPRIPGLYHETSSGKSHCVYPDSTVS